AFRASSHQSITGMKLPMSNPQGKNSHEKKTFHFNQMLFGSACAITLGGLYFLNSKKNCTDIDPQFIGVLNRYIRKHYGDLILPEEIIRQLSYLQTNSVKTPESNVRLSEE